MTLLVFAHVEPHHVLFGIEEYTCQSSRQLGLSNSRGTEEDERSDRSAGIFDAGACSHHSVGDQLNSFVLTDDPFVQDLIQMKELFAFLFEQAIYGNTSPSRDDVRNLIFAQYFVEQGMISSLGGELFLLRLEPTLQLRDGSVA